MGSYAPAKSQVKACSLIGALLGWLPGGICLSQLNQQGQSRMDQDAKDAAAKSARNRLVGYAAALAAAIILIYAWKRS